MVSFAKSVDRARRGADEEDERQGAANLNALSPFCTCGDLACPMHPANHGRGCAPCVAKNLERREIPSCFFHRLGPGGKPGAYPFEDFARAVLNRSAGE